MKEKFKKQQKKNKQRQKGALGTEAIVKGIFYLTDFSMEFNPKEELQYLFKYVITKNFIQLLKIKSQNME